MFLSIDAELERIASQTAQVAADVGRVLSTIQSPAEAQAILRLSVAISDAAAIESKLFALAQAVRQYALTPGAPDSVTEEIWRRTVLAVDPSPSFASVVDLDAVGFIPTLSPKNLA